MRWCGDLVGEAGGIMLDDRACEAAAACCAAADALSSRDFCSVAVMVGAGTCSCLYCGGEVLLVPFAEDEEEVARWWLAMNSSVMDRGDSTGCGCCCCCSGKSAIFSLAAL